MKAEKRIRTGSFFTPSIWVKKSQQYILKTLGKNWQKDYYVWDCASGTGNLLEGLDNYKKVFASTLEAEEVETIRERFDIPKNNAFQFDFLNDSFDNLPLDLQEIIKDPVKSSKLLIYINPPYGQPSDKSLINSNARGSAKKGMVDTKVRDEFFDKVGVGVNQLYVQFFLRIYKYIPNCKLACFTGVKYLNSKSFIGFRNYFKAKFLDGFVVPSDTFYNVKGKFPIGFLMWDLSIKEKMKKVALDVFDKEGKRIVGRELDKLIKGTDQYISKDNDKKGYSAESKKSINEWVDSFINKSYIKIGTLYNQNDDYQHNKEARFTIKDNHNHSKLINQASLLPSCIYLTARHIFNHTWLNNNDYFLYPTKKEYSAESNKSINEWVDKFDHKGESIGFLQKEISDFQHTHFIFINQKKVKRSYKAIHINKKNLLPTCIYLTARHTLKNTWLNSDDHFLYPTKKEYSAENKKSIGDWLREYKADNNSKYIGWIVGTNAGDFQHNKFVCILNSKDGISNPRGEWIAQQNILPVYIYLSIRNILKSNWLNGDDQFTHPKTKPLTWKDDKEFQNNCVACTLFHPQNRTSAKEGVNHWIPFTEKEVGAKGKFESNFMTNFLNAKLPKDNDGLFECKNDMTPTEPLKFSKEARDVFKAGLEIYKYYHAKDGSNPNYSLHDIRQHFQGFNSKGIMNSKSKDLEYQKLYDNLKDKLEILATEIRPKVYKYGFLDN